MPRTVNAEVHAVRRDAFVEVAQRLIQTKGYEQMSVQDVLDELGASRGAFYHYFDSKSALLEAVVEHMVEAATAELAQIPADPDLTPLQELEAVFNGIARWKAERSELVLAVLRVWLSDENAIVREKVRRGSAACLTPLLAEIVRRGTAKGLFTVSSPDAAADVLVALALGADQAGTDLYVARQAGTVVARGRRAYDRRLHRGLREGPRAAARVHDALRRRNPAPVVRRRRRTREGTSPQSAVRGAAAARHGPHRAGSARRTMTSIIATEKLSKSYGPSRGISALDLEVERGEAFGFLGPNGAGKTTTIRLLLDLIRPSAGRALVLGHDSRRESLAIRARSGYLPGELSLYPRLTGQETLRYLANLRGGIEWAYVGELAERLDCDLARRVADLSSGNKRKLGLIQAFMHRPELLILDEPTAGLDPLVQHEFYRLVDEAREAGQTVFLSSHVLPEVQRVCDRVAFIREGELVALEDVAALTGRAVREVEVVFAQPVPAAAFEGVPGVSNVSVNGKGTAALRLTVTGSLDPAIKKLAEFEVLNLTSREPDLEDVFMTFYAEKGDHDVA